MIFIRGFVENRRISLYIRMVIPKYFKSHHYSSFKNTNSHDYINRIFQALKCIRAYMAWMLAGLTLNVQAIEKPFTGAFEGNGRQC